MPHFYNPLIEIFSNYFLIMLKKSKEEILRMMEKKIFSLLPMYGREERYFWYNVCLKRNEKLLRKLMGENLLEQHTIDKNATYYLMIKELKEIAEGTIQPLTL